MAKQSLTLAQWYALVRSMNRRDKRKQKEYQRNFVSVSDLDSLERGFVREGYDDDHARELAAYERGYQSDVLPSSAW